MVLINPELRTEHFRRVFSKHRYLRVGLDAALASNLGEAYADQPDKPKTGFLRLGTFCYLGGKESQDFLALLRPGDTVVFDHPNWKSLLLSHSQTSAKLVNRFPFSNTFLDQARLVQILDGLPPSFEIKRIDEKLAAILNEAIEATCIYSSVFPTAQSFLKNGFGFCVVEKTSKRIASSCTTADVHALDVEVQVNTALPFRGKGLARAASAAFLLDCLQRGIRPHWDAKNAESSSLAKSVGFMPLEAYEVIEVS